MSRRISLAQRVIPHHRRAAWRYGTKPSFINPRPSSIVARHISTMSDYLADSDAPVVPLAVKPHFEALSAQEQRYAHHLSRASHYGTRVVLRQVSPESEHIYDLIVTIHSAIDGKWDTLASKAGVSDTEVTQFLEYASQFLSNLGNYKSFGDAKFIPRLSEEAFGKIASVDAKAGAMFDIVREPLYSTEPQESTLLGYPDAGHITSYYSKNVTKKEVEAVQKLMEANKILAENTRLFKDGDKLVLHIASASSSPNGEFKPEYNLDDGTKVEIKYGDHSAEFEKIAREIESAKQYAANDTQKKMLDAYAQSFSNGSMEAHKESQRHWVKDIGPKVETNIGFIETYRDPAGVRGEWEGLVAMVNKEQTEKFGNLVNNAKNYISQLPWDAAFEKDTFTPPDFTSLEVMTFAGSGIPAGINIPNYDDIRLTVGFKNVSLGNVLSAKAPNEKSTFLTPEDEKLFDEYRGPAFEVQVGIHELLGHGTGKLLSENHDGTFNFDHKNPPVSPLTGKPVETYYRKGQTWGSVFGAIAGSYEECRAETVAMYLACDRSLLKIFGHEGQEAEDVLYVAYLLMARAGLLALEFYDPRSAKWGQPHMQARFSILKSFLRAGDGFVKLEYTKPDYSDLVIKLDRSKIETVGKKAVGDYLQKLHVFKTTADFDNGSKLYADMTTVEEDIGKFRDAVLAAKRPRKQFVQVNTSLDSNGNVILHEYEPSYAGMIESFVQRNV
uniref:Dipeptidyl peptidase 3 n=1 Tax=Blastobotrys adeninivorans TaxID=409370 RepID=A0A060T491_BLAAD